MEKERHTLNDIYEEIYSEGQIKNDKRREIEKDQKSKTDRQKK